MKRRVVKVLRHHDGRAVVDQTRPQRLQLIEAGEHGLLDQQVFAGGQRQLDQRPVALGGTPMTMVS